jgi:hypothetical protein
MKRWMRNRPLFLAIGLGCLLAAGASAALAFPTPNVPWLSKLPNGVVNQASDAKATAYYTTINAPATFAAWQAAFGFDGTNETHAVYYNAGDLGFGRDMHCQRTSAGRYLACYVANHGFGPGGPPVQAVEDVLDGHNALPIVAMVYDSAIDGQVNDVAFYIYGSNGQRLNGVALDSQGDKYLPQLCLPCHGGYYFETNGGANVTIDGANFLPFDIASFQYTTRPGYALADQAEQFRQMNALVYDTNPYPGIKDLIDGWYNGQVTQPGQPFNANYVPAAYAASADDAELYTSVVRPYCRACHLSQSLVQLATPAEVDGARFDLFGSKIMPHSEMAAHNFWTSSAPAVVARNRGWSYRVTRLDDPPPSGCVPSDCTLRNAIWDANDPNASPGQDIITFDMDGTFNLDLALMDGGGALQITDSLVILGNGPDQTIIDVNGLDRVFHIHPGAEVIIKGVTIRGGSVSGSGGGILNEGGRLVLIDSIVQSNMSMGDGAGIANLSGGNIEIDRSTIGPNNFTTSGRGGGVFNTGSHLSLSNSTLSGNQAESGGGLYNLNVGAVVTVTFGTVTDNTATTTGGGLRNNGASLVVQNSLIVGNSGGGSTDCATSAGYTSLGHNLVGQNGNANGCPTVATDQVLAGGVATALDPNLSAPGGGVPYHALALGSPALDAIPLGAGCALPSYDERNTARPGDGNRDGAAACDVGAVEAPPQWRTFLPLVTR